MHSLLYDIHKTHEDNYKLGPIKINKLKKPLIFQTKTKYSFLGFPINIPFGIPAGPLLNSKFIKAAFDYPPNFLDKFNDIDYIVIMTRSREVNPVMPDFPARLSEALLAWAKGHPNPNEQIVFIGSEGKRRLTPQQLANEVVNQTPFGQERTRFYWDVSNNLGDKTGKRVLQDLHNCWRPTGDKK